MNSAMVYRVFVSSVQKELAEERRAIQKFIAGDALLRQFFHVFLFEDVPASDCRADEAYLSEVDRCAIYVGLFGNDYGQEDADGISPSEREFARATESGKTRLIFVKGADDTARHPKMRHLIRKAGGQVIRRRFNGIGELTAQVYASLVDFLQDRGIIKRRPFDDMECLDATVDDIDHEAVAAFVRQARIGRQFPIDPSVPAEVVLTHLGLLRENRPTNAAILLFGRNPQRFIPCAEVRCMHFHGTEIQRPAPFYWIFKGSLFAQVDQAANFVLSVTNVSVGTRALGAQAPVSHEIPPAVVREALVNAIAHREYTSGAAVQVAVFADRVEVWNPGELPPPLTPESLRHPHRSIARNHRICESLFLAGYIEKYGTGTLMMIRESLAQGLPEPVFQQQGGEFSAVIGRDWLTGKVLTELNLNGRQAKAIEYIKAARRMTNQDYQQITGATNRTAGRDLADLVAKGVFSRLGRTGRSASYTLVHKRDINRTNGTFSQGPRASSLQPVPGEVETTPGDRQLVAHDADNEAHDQISFSERQIMAACLVSPRSARELLTALGYSARTGNFKRGVKNLIALNLLELSLPDTPRSKYQTYRLTEKGRASLAKD